MSAPRRTRTPANTSSTRASLRDSPLARFLLAVYVLLVVYASLYPLAGWRGPGGSALGFLVAPWPRYVTAFDIGANFFGYVPFGLLCALVLRPRRPPAAAVALAVLGAAALSLALEAAQSFLPARIASNLDVLANVAGAACGAVGSAWLAPALLAGGPLDRLRAAALAPGVDRKSTRLNSSHIQKSRMPSSA